MTGTRFEDGKTVVDNWDRVFKAVSSEPRRQVVVSLLDAAPTATVPLPEAATNPNLPPDSESLELELHHTHLPLLAEMGYVDWARDPLRASRGDRFDEVGVVFEALHQFAAEIPDPLVVGCQRLEAERQKRGD